MAKLLFPNKRCVAKGFTLIETMIAMFIFVVGVLSLAALMCMVNLNTDRSRYIGTATLLATEKLEDLNRYPAASNAVAVSGGGDLGSDVTGYFDNVQVQSDNGAITEITYNADIGCYDVFTHSSITGIASESCVSTQPAQLSNSSNFHRRWKVETPITVSGNSVNVRRITVWVSLWSPTANAPTVFQGQPLTFQLSTVRP